MNRFAKYISYLPISVILLIAFVLRFWNLGYSDYQGDETQALFLPKDQTTVDFLLSQKKGPVQFITSALVKGLSDNYENYFITRLPSALAGFFAGVFLYLFVRKILGPKAALFTLIFYSTNGLFVAFSRIVQYQSLVLLFITLCLYFCYLFFETNKWRFMYLSLLFWSIGLLTHSDSIFIGPVILSIIVSWIKKYKVGYKRAIIAFLPSFLVMAVVLLGFYIPLVLHADFATQNYWIGRFTGEVTNGIISSTYLYSLYQPVYGLVIYMVLGSMGLIAWFLTAVLKKIYLMKSIYIWVGFVVWFVFGLIFMEVLTKFPGTHIWVYVLPLCIFIGYFLSVVDLILPKFSRVIYYPLIFVLFMFLSAQSHTLFIDNMDEYPWSNKNFLLWKLDRPDTRYQLSLFGFPYQRRWKDIRDFIIADGKSSYYSVNEKISISRYYIPLEKSNSKAGYFIHIVKPQTFNNVTLNNRGARWMQENDPVKTFFYGKNEVARIYLVPQTW